MRDRRNSSRIWKSVTGPAEGESFLKGPISEQWLNQIAKLPGKSWRIFLALVRESDMAKSDNLKLTWTHIARSCGVSRTTVYRALLRLEEKGFLSLRTRRGAKSQITLLREVPIDS